MLLTFSKILLNQDGSQPWSDAAAESLTRLESFILDSYGTRDPDVTQIFLPSKKLRVHPHIDFDVGLLKAGISAENLPMVELPSVIQEINRNILRYVTRSINPNLHYYICFDELDRGFDPNDKDYFLRLIGLILAANKINLAIKERGGNASILVFLRDDIYQRLKFEDKNRITENRTAVIEWDLPTSSHTLKQLMERRFAKVLGIPAKGSWETVFDETREMTGHQTKYQHILDRTFLRPRDVIRFCNQVLEQYKASGSRLT